VPQNTFLTTPDVEKYLFYGHAQMHQNTFLTTPDAKKYLYYDRVSGGLEEFENASKHVFNHSRC
jgi:hypothetical protein